MKSSYLRAGIALACALGLSACGGSSGQLVLAGSAFGVTKTGLILQNNGGSDYAVVPTGANPLQIQFPTLVDVDSSYNVTVKTVNGVPAIPTNAEACTVSNGTGRSAFNITNIVVSCSLKTHALRGVINGLGNATGLVIVNGSDRKPITPGATPGPVDFVMTPVGEDQPYGITVLPPQPAGLNCTVSPNGVGTMGTTDITDVVINCVPAA
jgi:hypothetical protein